MDPYHGKVTAPGLDPNEIDKVIEDHYNRLAQLDGADFTPISEHKCTCPITVLLQSGCVCGGT